MQRVSIPLIPARINKKNRLQIDTFPQINEPFYIPENTPQQIPQYIPQQIPEYTELQIPEYIPQQIPQYQPMQYVPVQMKKEVLSPINIYLKKQYHGKVVSQMHIYATSPKNQPQSRKMNKNYRSMDIHDNQILKDLDLSRENKDDKNKLITNINSLVQKISQKKKSPSLEIQKQKENETIHLQKIIAKELHQKIPQKIQELSEFSHKLLQQIWDKYNQEIQKPKFVENSQVLKIMAQDKLINALEEKIRQLEDKLNDAERSSTQESAQ